MVMRCLLFLALLTLLASCEHGEVEQPNPGGLIIIADTAWAGDTIIYY